MSCLLAVQTREGGGPRHGLSFIWSTSRVSEGDLPQSARSRLEEVQGP